MGNDYYGPEIVPFRRGDILDESPTATVLECGEVVFSISNLTWNHRSEAVDLWVLEDDGGDSPRSYVITYKPYSLQTVCKSLSKDLYWRLKKLKSKYTILISYQSVDGNGTPPFKFVSRVIPIEDSDEYIIDPDPNPKEKSPEPDPDNETKVLEAIYPIAAPPGTQHLVVGPIKYTKADTGFWVTLAPCVETTGEGYISLMSWSTLAGMQRGLSDRYTHKDKDRTRISLEHMTESSLIAGLTMKQRRLYQMRIARWELSER